VCSSDLAEAAEAMVATGSGATDEARTPMPVATAPSVVQLMKIEERDIEFNTLSPKVRPQISDLLSKGERGTVEDLVDSLQGWLDSWAADKSKAELTSQEIADRRSVKDLRDWILQLPEYNSEQLQKEAEAAAIAKQKKEIALATKNSLTARKKNAEIKDKPKAEAKAKKKAEVAAASTGIAVLDSLGIKQAVTPLKDVKIGGIYYKTHLSLLNFKDLYRDSGVTAEEILKGLHFTVELEGKDDKGNPRYWPGTGEHSGPETNKPTRSYFEARGKYYLDLLAKLLPG